MLRRKKMLQTFLGLVLCVGSATCMLDICHSKLPESERQLLTRYTWIIPKTHTSNVTFSSGTTFTSTTTPAPSTKKVSPPPLKGVELFYVSFCSPLNSSDIPPKCRGARACHVRTDGAVESIPFNENSRNATLLRDKFLFMQSDGRTTSSNRVFGLIFKLSCGSSLGSPNFYFDAYSQYFFEWKTLAACQLLKLSKSSKDGGSIDGGAQNDDAGGKASVDGTDLSANFETQCVYVDPKTGEKFDFSPLVRSRGGFMVESSHEDVRMWLNVCANMKLNGTIIPCANKTDSNIAACIQRAGEVSVSGSIQFPRTRLLRDRTGVFSLVYPPAPGVTQFPTGCANAPSTEIRFRCPYATTKTGQPNSATHRTNSGFIRPRLISDTWCHYVVQWDTDHACPVAMLTGDGMRCTMQRSIHGVSFNLSSLAKPYGQSYDIKVPASYSSTSTLDGTEYRFYNVSLNVCGGAPSSTACGKRTSKSSIICAAVQKRPPQKGGDANKGGQQAADWETTAISLGSPTDVEFKFVDGRLSLVYEGGSQCGETGKWFTVIEFVCDQESDKEPRVMSVDGELCSIQIGWPTPLACVPDTDALTRCSITTPKGINYDIIPLSTAFSGFESSWRVEDLSSFNAGENQPTIMVDACAPVKLPTTSAIRCSKTTAVCYMDPKMKRSLRLGSYTSATLGVDENVGGLLLRYGNGSRCFADGGRPYTTTIHLICAPGADDSGPVFIDDFDPNTECDLELEWRTQFACPKGIITNNDNNNNCAVRDDSLGIDIDLGALKNVGVREIVTSKRSFQLGICTELPPTVCGKKYSHVGSCQHDRASGSTWSLPMGDASRASISYYDGVVNLTYPAVEKEGARVGGVTTVMFICDNLRGVGDPEFSNFDEKSAHLTVLWSTSIVCPHQALRPSCFVTDSKTGNQYDLSRLHQLHPNSDWSVLTSPMIEGNMRSLFFSSLNGQKMDEFRQRFYLQICSPLKRPPPKPLCDPNASACITRIYNKNNKEIAEVPNAGMSVSPPTVESPYQLKIVLSNGQACDRFGVKVNHTTEIHLLCDRSQDDVLRYLGPLGSCKQSFLWVTQAACPIQKDSVISKDVCRVSHFGKTVDLSFLKHKTFYTVVKNKTAFYELNICGAIDMDESVCANKDNRSVSVCFVSDNTTYPIAVSDGYTLERLDDDGYRLNYLGIYENDTGKTHKVTIDILCDGNQHSEKDFGFIRARTDKRGSRSHHFTVYTEHVCVNDASSLIEDVGGSFCEFFDSEGNVFDLSKLSRRGSSNNWELWASNNRSKRFHLNFCRPLNFVDAYSCPPDSFACMTDIVDMSRPYHPVHSPGISLGRKPAPKPTFGHGTVQWRYTAGDLCTTAGNNTTDGKPPFYETRVILSCAPRQTHPIVLFDVDDESQDPCVVSIYMDTPAACPLKQSIGDDCEVIEPNYGYIFDLNPLRNATRNYVLKDGMFSLSSSSSPEYSVTGTSFLINVCGPLVNAASTHAQCGTNVSVCRITTERNVTTYQPAGLSTSLLTYRNGVITALFKSPGEDGSTSKETPVSDSERCSLHGWSTMVEFTCVHDSGVGTPRLLSEDPQFCRITIEWATVHACPPFTIKDCVVKHPYGGTIDLSRLSDPRNDYVAVGSPDNQTYVLNVCRSVVHQPGVLCVFTSGACSISSTQTLNLGRVTDSPYLGTDGAVHIRYSRGSQCPADPRRYLETHIVFYCSETVLEGRPLFVSSDNCTFEFVWHTRYACVFKDIQGEPENTTTSNKTVSPINPSTPVVPPTRDVCRIKHPLYGNVIDLTNLSRAQDSHYRVNVTSANGDVTAVVSLNLCVTLANSKCTESGVGACLEANGMAKSIGTSSSRLRYNSDQGSLYIRMENGSVCPSSSRNSRIKRATTTIHFVCPMAGREDKDGPEYVRDDGCNYHFVWRTERVCNNAIRCVYRHGDDLMDLSGLAARSSYTVYSALDPTALYYISVCHPLDPSVAYGGHAVDFPGAAIIRVVDNFMSGSTQFVESLGRPIGEPFVDFEESVSLLYVNGSRCRNNLHERNKARIVFVCDPQASVGRPELTSIDEWHCVYHFEWLTQLVCPRPPNTPQTISGQFKKSCNVTVPQMGINIDLRPLFTYSPYSVNDSSGKGQFFIAVCLPRHQVFTDSPACKDQDVCWIPENTKAKQQAAPGSSSVPATNTLLLRATALNTKPGLRSMSLSKPESGVGYGAQHSFSYDVISRSLVVHYRGGSACGNGLFASADVVFTCDRKADLGKPILSKQYSCHAIFEWPTATVCPPDPGECRVSSQSGKVYDLTPLSSVSHAWPVHYDDRTYWINLCRTPQDPSVIFSVDVIAEVAKTGKKIASRKELRDYFAWPQYCPQNAAVCVVHDQKPDDDLDALSSVFALGQVHSQHITINDRNEVVVRYTGGDAHACAQYRSSSGGSASSTPAHAVKYPEVFIVLECDPENGEHVGSPEIENVDDAECTAHFRWKTRFACPTNMLDDDRKLNVVNGILFDDRHGLKFNVSRLFEREYRAVDSRGFEYIFRLGGGGFSARDNNAEKRSTAASSNCGDQTAICQRNRDTKELRDLGDYSRERFMLRGADLMLEVESLVTTCDYHDVMENNNETSMGHTPLRWYKNSGDRVRTMISFVCSHDASTSPRDDDILSYVTVFDEIREPHAEGPVFLYESRSCHYVFEWYTSAVCPSVTITNDYIPANRRMDYDTTYAGEAKATRSSTLLFISLMLVLMVVMFALFVTRKQNRQKMRSGAERVWNNTRRCFRNASLLPRYRYTKTPGTEMQSPLDNDGDTVLLSPNLVLFQGDEEDERTPPQAVA